MGGCTAYRERWWGGGFRSNSNGGSDARGFEDWMSTGLGLGPSEKRL